jgi:hypothetical protein
MESNNQSNPQQPIAQPIPPTQPVQNQPIQNPPVMAPVDKPKSKFRFIKIFLISSVVLFIIAALATWFMLHELNSKLAAKGTKVSIGDLQKIATEIKNKKSLPGTIITHPPFQGQANPSVSTPEQEPSQNDTTVQTNQWNTYENKGYGFSINFPADLVLNDKPQGFGVTNIELKSPDSQPSDGPVYQILVFPKALAKIAGVDFDADYALADNSNKTISDNSGNTQTYTKINNRTVGSLKAYNFKNSSSQTSSSDGGIGTAVEFGDSVVMISTLESNREELDTMMTSFKYPL